MHGEELLGPATLACFTPEGNKMIHIEIPVF